MPIKVLVFRLIQSFRLTFIHKLGLWRSFHKNWHRYESKLRKEHDINCLLPRSVLNAGNIEQKKQQYAHKSNEIGGALIKVGQEITSGGYILLGNPMVPLSDIDWHSDWRFDHTWKARYYKKYSFYENRDKPYDVKYPWELSRLQFVIPLLENAILFPEEKRWFDKVDQTIRSWAQENPLANSVAWYPMEASMRLTCLVQLLDMTLLLARQNSGARELAIVLAGLIAEHGHFVWENREYTADCGNHYAANISGLCVAGLALRNIYPKSKKWLRFAHAEVQKETLNQFYPDGVNFEKSTGYHRLVTELFLMSVIGLENAGFSVDIEVKERLHNACRFARDMVRPDGRSVNFGDNDNAIVFNFRGLPPRDYGDFLNVACAYFRDQTLLPKEQISDFVSMWFNFNSNDLAGTSKEAISPICRVYRDGGYVAVRQGENHLFVDVGEVGQRGLGGHGHNDLFSFELSMAGQPIIIDPGCPVYTGDQAKRNKYRSSFSHNIATVDNIEIAQMPSFWRIEDTAIPRNVRVDEFKDEQHIVGSHTGYEALKSPVEFSRNIISSFKSGIVRIEDYFSISDEHQVRRRFTFSPDMCIKSDRANCILLVGVNSCYEIEWEPSATANLEDIMVSDGFGSEVASKALILHDQVVKSSALSVLIKEIRKNP